MALNSRCPCSNGPIARLFSRFAALLLLGFLGCSVSSRVPCLDKSAIDSVAKYLSDDALESRVIIEPGANHYFDRIVNGAKSGRIDLPREIRDSLQVYLGYRAVAYTDVDGEYVATVEAYKFSHVKYAELWYQLLVHRPDALDEANSISGFSYSQMHRRYRVRGWLIDGCVVLLFCDSCL